MGIALAMAHDKNVLAFPANSDYRCRMQTFLFQSQFDDEVAAFTVEHDGGNLPMHYAPWKLVGSQVIRTGVSGQADAVLVGIKRDGFFLARSQMRTAPPTIH